MLKVLRPLAGFIEGLIDRVGSLTAWIALVMIGLVATNVLLRYAFSFGSVWAQELEWHLLAALILLGVSHAVQRGGAPDDPRVGPSARLDWLADVNAWQLQRLAEKRQGDASG